MKPLKHFLNLTIVFSLLLLITCCEKQEVEPEYENGALKAASISDVMDIDDQITVFGPAVFKRVSGKPSQVTKKVEIEHYDFFEAEYTIVVENVGGSVTSAIIKIDDKEVFSPNDFKKKMEIVKKDIKLTSGFNINVELRGTPEGLLRIWIIAELSPGHSRISSDGGTCISANELLTVSIPSNIISDEYLYVEIDEIDPENMINEDFITAGPIYSISSEIEVFQDFVELRFALKDGDNDGIIDNSNLSLDHAGVAYFDEESQQWVMAEQYVDKEAKEILVKTKHFSFWMVVDLFEPIGCGVITWSIESVPPSVQGDNYKRMIDFSFNMWEKYTKQFDLQFAEVDINQDPNIIFTVKDWQDPAPLATTSYLYINSIRNRKITINTFETYDNLDGTILLLYVLSHEIGHAIGLDHSCFSCSGPPLMAAKAAQDKLGIHDNDITQMIYEYTTILNWVQINDELENEDVLIQYDFEDEYDYIDRSGNEHHFYYDNPEYTSGRNSSDLAIKLNEQNRQDLIIPSHHFKYLTFPFTYELDLLCSNTSQPFDLFVKGTEFGVHIENGSVAVFLYDGAGIKEFATVTGFIDSGEWSKLGISFIDKNNCIFYSGYKSELVSDYSEFGELRNEGNLYISSGTEISLDKFILHNQAFEQDSWEDYLVSIGWEDSNSGGPQYGLLTDPRDGEVYKTVQIGDQVWMAEDLRATRYSDGSAIPYVGNASNWYSLSNNDRAYTWYENDGTYKNEYGALYNWAAAMNGEEPNDSNPSQVQGVCPDGWHLPSDSEWKELEMYLGMSQSDANSVEWRQSGDVGGKLKEVGTDHWWPNTLGGATNETGFSAVGSGVVFDEYQYVDRQVYYWTATTHEIYSGRPWIRSLFYGSPEVYRNHNYHLTGFSVRCIED